MTDRRLRIGLCAGAVAGLTALALAGCSPIGAAIGAASTVGVAAVQERSLDDAATDTRIRVALNDVFLSRDLSLFSAVDFAVVEGRVLLVGNVPSPDDRDYAARTVWAIDGVEQVINELQVGPAPGLSQIADDRWAAAQLKAALFRDGAVADVNYWVLVNDGTIYLLGVALAPGEVDRVVAHAHNIPGIRRVVSHVILKSDPRRAS
ncbi:MAG: BON domain-containing protein [Sneathiellaceae bacterium]